MILSLRFSHIQTGTGHGEHFAVFESRRTPQGDFSHSTLQLPALERRPATARVQLLPRHLPARIGIHIDPRFRLRGDAPVPPYGWGTLPVAEKIAGELLLLPMHPGLSAQDLDDMVEATRKVAGAYRR